MPRRHEDDRRELVLDEVAEALPEVGERHAARRGELRELVRVLEVVLAEPDHVAARDRVARRVDVDHPHLRPPRLRVEHLLERDRDEVPSLHRDHRPRAAREDVLRRAVAEVPRVLEVEGDRVGAAELVADVLVRDGRLHAELLELLLDGRLQDLADVHVGDPEVPVGVALGLREPLELLGVELEDEPFGDDRDAVPAPVAEALEDRPDEGVDDRAEADLLSLELLGHERERRARGLADAEGEVARLPPHRDDEVPARRRPRVDHQVLDDLDADVARRLEPERVDVGGEVEVVVDRLRDVDDGDPPVRLLGELHRGEGRVVAADRDETRDVQTEERDDGVLEELRVLRRVRAGDADVRAAAEVDPGDLVDRERVDVLDVPLHEPLEAVADAEDRDPLELGADRRRADDAVDSGRRPAADEDRQVLVLARGHGASIRKAECTAASRARAGREPGAPVPGAAVRRDAVPAPAARRHGRAPSALLRAWRPSGS